MQPSRFSLLTLSIGAATLAGAVLAGPRLLPEASAADPPDAATTEQLRHARDLSLAFKSAAKRVGPSVVRISSVARVSPRGGREDAFGRLFGDRGWRLQPDDGQASGSGSGLLVSADGFIVTNNHVIDGADAIAVRLADDREMPATVIGVDIDTDLAILKIEESGLPAATWGNSDGLEVGEWVLAVGTPFGLNQTVTAGIVSAVGRSDMGLATYEDFIQTDAAINPGNSGGPLVNLHGEVVGINTAITTRGGGSLGIGFAIPSTMVQEVVEDLLDDGVVDRGWLGVSPRGLTTRLAGEMGFVGRRGVFVAGVVPDAPADSAGIRPGDIILTIGGRATTSPTELRRVVAEFDPRSQVDIELFREGERTKVPVVLGQRPLPRPIQVPRIDLGLRVSTSPSSSGLEGVLIDAVAPRGPGARLGLRPGDLIVEIDEQPVRNVDEYQRRLTEHDVRKDLRIVAVRDGVPQQFVVQIR